MKMPALTDQAEEILEHLWIRTEEEKQPADLSLMRDEDALQMLQRLDLVLVDDGSATLSDEGREAAEHCVRRHRLAERLLADILDTGEEHLHSASCKFEHGLHRGLEERVCTMLGHPRTCPHGKPIPPGECCRQLEREPGQLLAPVSELGVNESATVAYLQSEEIENLRKLMAMGALPGTELVVKQRFPSYVIRMENSQFAIDRELAEKIYVRRTGGNTAKNDG